MAGEVQQAPQPDFGTPDRCVTCGGSEGGCHPWGDALAMTHGFQTWRCRRCILTDQLAHAREIADRIPELESALAALASSPGASDWQCQVCGALESKGGCGHDFELHYAEVSSPGREGRDGGTDEGPDDV